MRIETVWFSDSLWARGVRGLLAPASWCFRAAATWRAARYDAPSDRVIPSPIPVISVGNLSVGGTGKTPFSAWLVRQLQTRGARPAIVMRGYGDDEPLVHRVLSPDVPVYTGVDRVSSIAQAAAAGCNVVVLDDGFQHRRAGRLADIVLLSADAWPASGNPRVLPAGPFREPLSALQRATLVVITGKSASPDAIARVRRAVHTIVPSVPTAVVRFALGELVDASSAVVALDAESRAPVVADATPSRLPLTALRDVSVLAIAAIGEPQPFFRQLRACGARIVERSFRDHHPFSRAEIEQLAAESSAHKYVVSTLKDAVKLAPDWPAKGRPLWYVSQAVEVNDGQSFIETLILDIMSHCRP